VFVNVNRSKRSIILDLQSDEGKTTLRALIATADVFIHSMRSKAIARLGFDYAAVAAIKPDIVWTNCCGYGRRGPYRDRPAYDDTIQAEYGLTAVQQRLTGEASFVGTIVVDKVAGMTGLCATMMALFRCARTGEGQEVEVAMFERMAAFMLVEHANGAPSGANPECRGFGWIFQPWQVRHRGPHKRRGTGLSQCLPPPRRAAGCIRQSSPRRRTRSPGILMARNSTMDAMPADVIADEANVFDRQKSRHHAVFECETALASARPIPSRNNACSVSS
jgi:hypothetical protein